MKKLCFIALVLCTITSIATAQKTYIRLGVGGGDGLKEYNDKWINRTATLTTIEVESKSLGLGSGFNVNLAFGYMVSDNIGIELGVNEYIGMNKKFHYSYDATYTDSTQDYKIKGMMLQVIPAILLTPKLEKINPYARLGMIIGVMPSVTDNYSATANGIITLKSTTTASAKSKLSGGVALGFTAAGGASFNLSDKLSLFGELVYNGINYAPKKGEYKEWTVNGEDQLVTATTKEKEWTFEKKYVTTENIPDSSPDKVQKTSFTFSNVELNIGIKLKL